MKFTKTLAGVSAAAVAVSSLALCAFAEREITEEEQAKFDLLTQVASVSATLKVNELAPADVTGFASFYMQNNGGDWAWFAAPDEAEESFTLEGAGEYEVVWSDIQSVITVTKGDKSKTKLLLPAESWENIPAFGIQVGSNGITEPGQEGKVDAEVSNVVITLVDGTEVAIADFAVAGDLLGKQEDWGISGNNVMVNMADALYEAYNEADAEPDGFTFTMGATGVGADAKAAMTVKVLDDVTSLDFVATALVTEEGDGAFNDWCGEIIKVTNPDGTVNYYDWGGKSVTWGVDCDGDDEADTFGNVDGSTSWLGSVEDGIATISVPVVKGSIVEFFCNSWTDNPEIEQFAIAIVTNVEETEAPVVTPEEPEDPEEPEEPTDSDVVVPGESSGTNVPTGSALAFAPVAFAAVAVAGSAIVLKKRSK